ncbi:hypothetical protein GCM10023347_27480 [Streptomyces chumphonensis]|uniref:DUF6177 family protein n=1 Tax=Streptomyces chumphonensis TaxID=1214925 RepID=UPI001CD0542E|nr:DUF6177 family protein [Streptomyces chumphonensis]
MTKDVIALTERMPDSWTLLAGLLSGGPDTHLATVADGAVVQLTDADGRPLASVEAPMLVQVPGEVRRLLGLDADRPVWWTEVRAATTARGGDRLAGTIATRLVTRLGGAVWPPAALVPDAGTPVRDVTAATPAAAQPAVDVLTDEAAVVIQDRPVIAMTAWLSETLRATTDSERALQLVTPPTARLSLPTRSVLSGLPNRWVVQDPGRGYFDGLSGAELRWENGSFTATGKLVDGYAPPTPPTGRQLGVSLRTRHRATTDLLLGGALEETWQRLTGTLPAGWGTAEPAGAPWSREELSAYVRERAEPTWLVVVGQPERPAIATLRVSVTESGVEEDMTLTVGHPEDGPEPALAELPGLAAELAAHHGLVSLLAQQRHGRADLTVPCALEGPPEPVGFALGPGEIAEIGLTAARRAPSAGEPVQLGPASRAGMYYPLAEAGWGGLQELAQHLRATDARGKPAEDDGGPDRTAPTGR